MTSPDPWLYRKWRLLNCMFGRHGWMSYCASSHHGRDTARDCCYCPARQIRGSIFVPWHTVG